MVTSEARIEWIYCQHFEQANTVPRCWFERDRNKNKPRRCIHLKQGDCELITESAIELLQKAINKLPSLD